MTLSRDADDVDGELHEQGRGTMLPRTRQTDVDSNISMQDVFPALAKPRRRDKKPEIAVRLHPKPRLSACREDMEAHYGFSGIASAPSVEQ
ncbi:hypothetical protein LZ31DRAFT_555023 [Colletotrichum somersetense]|nr:hypothetical protein LZ31DRAFT_555023 [Colletotrichum somersetense]